MCSGSFELFKFCEIGDNISETVQVETWLQWKSNWKSYVAYQMGNALE